MPERPSPADAASAAGALGIPLSPARAARLTSFASLLEERAVPLGLIARSDAGRVWERHVLDSLRAAPFLGDARTLYDIGSGAGLPGIVLAIALPQSRMTLVESSSRKAGFLELAVDQLRLPNVAVAVARAESLTQPVDAATARALAPVDRSWRIAAPLLRRGGKLVYFAGRGIRDPELAAAALEDPEPPASVRIARGLATASPLVIMTRG